MFALAETMYLCRTLGELLRMHSGCFCYRSNNVWFWKEQGWVSFAEMKCQKCKHFGAHNTPLPMQNANEISCWMFQLFSLYNNKMLMRFYVGCFNYLNIYKYRTENDDLKGINYKMIPNTKWGTQPLLLVQKNSAGNLYSQVLPIS